MCIIKKDGEISKTVQTQISSLRELERQKTELENKINEIKESLMFQMNEEGIDKFAVVGAKVALVAEGVIEKFDVTAFKKQYPEMVSQFLKESKRKSYIKVTWQ